MATLTIGLAGSAIITGSKSYTISDADVQRLLNAMAIKYEKRDAVTGAVITQTNGQLLLQWVNGFVTDTIDYVKAREVSAAQKTAEAGTAPIVMA